ncbi:hypothetical protein [Kibdelosporangium phytohabitans]|uniref:Uncharacterized protein n=1 Tax=Kibdelosporangium phytohabitans TaxID=860235 RepID=A0A0N9HUV7_9PSEU|nr:hypothetical protein [Kibdelosporangium phytohabitans]ALG06697.1 hypothetical protein AOZ06_06930 [Kibdelosporangium phytohabitans]MBE1467915.1 hypothetical protein [Kibdelosporangium phytohabitans]
MAENVTVGWQVGADVTDWQLTVESRARRVRADLAALPSAPATEVARKAADVSLEIVDVALRSADNKWWRSGASWWSGWHIERAWRALHEAEIYLAAADPDLPSRLPGLRARVRMYLEEGDPRRAAMELENPDRATVVDAMRAAFDASDDAHAAARALRNKLIVISLALFVLNTVLGLVGLIRPGLVPMCMPPNLAVQQPLCPTGTGAASGWDVWMVQLFGALGATISVVLLLIRRRPDLSPYVLVGYQALVKILLGATLSAVGLLALGAGLVSGIVYVGSQAALLLWAVLFGYAQQVGTRLLDNYADRLMDEVRPLPDRVTTSGGKR